MEAFSNENLVDDRAGGDLQKRGKYHESVTGKAILLLSKLSQVFTAVLNKRLETVFKCCYILLTKTQEKDSTANSEQGDQEWDSSSE